MVTKSTSGTAKWVLLLVIGAVAVSWIALVRTGKQTEPTQGVGSSIQLATADQEREPEPPSSWPETADPRTPATGLPDLRDGGHVESHGTEIAAAEAESQPDTAFQEPRREYFPHGRPTPDWVFEQKYGGMQESEFLVKREEVAAAYALASKLAFNECWDKGNFELIPRGQPQALPNDDRILGGRVLPGASETQVVRLNVDEYPEVYELFYEHLWLQTTPWKP